MTIEESVIREQRRGVRAQLRALILAVAAILVLAGVVFWRISASYQPLEAGNWFSPAQGAPDHLRWIGNQNAQRLTGAVGTVQTLEWPLVNTGDHPITITSAEPPHPHLLGESAVVRLAWAPYRPWPGGLISGHPSASKSFPAHLAAHATIKIRITVRKPACPGHGVAFDINADVKLHWHAMISSHTTIVPGGGGDYALVVCGPA